MRLLTFLIFIILSIPALSQPGKPLHKVILFENHKRCIIVRISEGQQINLNLKSGEKVAGPVRRICGDTLFIGDTILFAGNIAGIRKIISPDPPFGNKMHGSQGLVLADTSVWKIVCPPPEIYSSRWSYQSYLNNRKTKLKREKNKNYNPLLYNNFLKFNLSKLAHLEIAFAYERVIAPKLSWETEISFIFGLQNADAYYTINYPLYNYNGFSITTNPKYYIINPRTYLGMVFMYRYLWFNQVRTGWPDNNGNGELQDQFRNDYGLSLRLGVMRRYGHMVIDWYIGGGVKVIQLHQLVYGNYYYHDSSAMRWRHEDHSPDVSDRTLFGPVINAGIKIGLGF